MSESPRRERWLRRRELALLEVAGEAFRRRHNAELDRLRATVTFGAGFQRLLERLRALQLEGWTLTPEEEAQLTYACSICGQPPVWRSGARRARRRNATHCGRPRCWQQAHRNRRRCARGSAEEEAELAIRLSRVDERAYNLRAAAIAADVANGLLDVRPVAGRALTDEERGLVAILRVLEPTERFRVASEIRAAELEQRAASAR